MANAPDQANLDRYQKAFNAAVEATTQTIQATLDNGYLLGLLLAPGLVAGDFDALKDPRAPAGLQAVVTSLGHDHGDAYSSEFTDSVRTVLEKLNRANTDAETRARLQQILGEEDGPGSGVGWRDEDEGPLPGLSDTFAQGAIATLNDVRDEATRRMRTAVAMRHRIRRVLKRRRGGNQTLVSDPTAERAAQRLPHEVNDARCAILKAVEDQLTPAFHAEALATRHPPPGVQPQQRFARSARPVKQSTRDR